MFTGHIGRTATVVAVSDNVLRVRIEIPGELRNPGSVCLDGVRFTLHPAGEGELVMALTDETRRRTTLDRVEPGQIMNAEFPLIAGERVDGHLVQGYVEGVGRVLRVDVGPAGRRVWIKAPDRMRPRIVAKSSIAVDGVSLTIAEVLKDRFAVVLVPNTLQRTTLGSLAEGDRVNLESDLLVRMAADGQGPALMAAVAKLPWIGLLDGPVGVEQAVAQIAAGGAVVVWDPTAEGEGDVVFAGQGFRPDAMRFLLTQACGHTTVPCSAEVLERLEISPIPGAGDRQGTAMHVPVDLAAATGTGVAAAERAATIRRLAAPDAVPTDFTRPGHVFPLAARPGLLAERQGHTEATVALCQAAGLPAVGVCCEVMRADGVMANAADLEQFALHWNLPMINIHDLASWL